MFENFLSQIPDLSNPFVAMWFAFTHGGWFLVGYAIIWSFWKWWLFERNNLYWAHIPRTLLAIHVPKETEQGPKAVENFFAHLMGVHTTHTLWELWWEGRVQENFTCEIASHEGTIQYYLWVPTYYRDVFETSLYAQYPDAEIKEVEDYVTPFPKWFPNPTHNMWGVELVLKKHWVYPIKTYEQFEDKLDGTFKDPLTSLLEYMTSMKAGENFWVQILVRPCPQKWQEKSHHEVEKLIGKKPEKKAPFFLVGIFHFFIEIVGFFFRSWVHPNAHIGEEEAGHKGGDNDPPTMMLHLSPGQKEVVEHVERKASKLGFETKVRLLYIANSEVFNKKQAITGIMGSFRAFSDMHSNTFGLGKLTFVSAHYLFTEWRKNRLKNIVMRGYRARSQSRGEKSYILNIEELATLWHFPSIEVKTPLIKKSESKKAEPPHHLPQYMEKRTATPMEYGPDTPGDLPPNLPFA